MSNLKEEILIPAWDIVKSDLKIKRFYFIPWLLSVIFLTVLLVYQSIYTYVKIFDKKHEVFLIILKFFESSYVTETLISITIFVVLYILILPIFEWWLIKYIDNKNWWNQIGSLDSIWLWLYSFLPLFEYNNIFSEFKLISILNWFLFFLRFFDFKYIWVLFIVFTSLFLFSLLINISFAYTKYEIIIWNKKVFQAIWWSSRITMLNLKTTIKLYFIMFLLNVRVVFNFLIFLSFPIVTVALIWFISSKVFLTITVVLLLIIFVILILLLWYLTAVLDVFKASIWYFAYIKWKEKMLKQIEEEK